MAENGTQPMPAPTDAGEAVKEKPGEVAPAGMTTTELPADVRSKLRKLEKLESRYQGILYFSVDDNALVYLQTYLELLRSYRVAHARAVSIEPFEKTLKENTPLVSISEPGALVEYLNQLNLRGDMVMDELKRVTTDRDDYKKKFEEARNRCPELRKSL